MKKQLLLILSIWFLSISLAQANGARVEIITAENTQVKSPFLANAIVLKNTDPSWIRFPDNENWMEANEIVLKESISELEWTVCNPTTIDPIDCLNNSRVSPEIVFINTEYNKWNKLKNIVASYRRIIRQIGNTDAVESVPFKIYSREEWGANESWRYSSVHNGGKNERVKSYAAGDKEILDVIYTENGKELWWPVEHIQKNKKIVIHHTATSGYLSNPEASMRAIYLYHALEKNWGDIGYHYVISPDGKIFQGRVGSDQTVGGHTGGFNIGTIGIAIMGDFTNRSFSGAAKESLEKLIDHLSDKHSIQKNGMSFFHGTNMPNILGHRDLNATECPGDYLYQEVKRLRGGLEYSRVEEMEKDETEKRDQENGQKNKIILPSIHVDSEENILSKYEFEIVSGEENRIGRVGDILHLSLILKNVGNAVWKEDNIFLKSAKGWQNDLFEFRIPTNRIGRIASMAQKTVNPGTTALFRFSVKLKRVGEGSIDVFPVWGEVQPMRGIEIKVKVIE